MNEEIPQGYNIGWDIVGDRCVTTGACPALKPFGGWYLRFETFIWHYDEDSEETDKRGRILDQIFHRSEKEAKKVHGYIVKNLKAKEATHERGT